MIDIPMMAIMTNIQNVFFARKRRKWGGGVEIGNVCKKYKLCFEICVQDILLFGCLHHDYDRFIVGDGVNLYAGGERRFPSFSKDCWTALIINWRKRGSCLGWSSWSASWLWSGSLSGIIQQCLIKPTNRCDIRSWGVRKARNSNKRPSSAFGWPNSFSIVVTFTPKKGLLYYTKETIMVVHIPPYPIQGTTRLIGILR